MDFTLVVHDPYGAASTHLLGRTCSGSGVGKGLLVDVGRRKGARSERVRSARLPPAILHQVHAADRARGRSQCVSFWGGVCSMTAFRPETLVAIEAVTRALTIVGLGVGR